MQEIEKTFTYDYFFHRLKENVDLYAEVNKQMIINGLDPLGTLIAIYEDGKGMLQDAFKIIEGLDDKL